MESYEVLREALDKASAKQVAQALGVSLSLIYKWAQPRGTETQGGIANPLDRAEELLRVLRDPALIKWLCQRCGGCFVRNPRAGEDAKDLAPATNDIVQQFADLLAAITDGARDARITKDETRPIRRQWEELKSVTEGFVRACEEGTFSK